MIPCWLLQLVQDLSTSDRQCTLNLLCSLPASAIALYMDVHILNEMKIERNLYLAVPRSTFNSVFTIELGQILLKNQIIKLIVFDDENEVIVEWIPN